MAMSTRDNPGKPETPETAAAKQDVKSDDPTRLDTTVASETAAQQVVDASPLVPDADRVAMVSRDKDGNADQSENYAVLVADDAPERVKDAAYNKPGEILGAKNVKENKP